MKYNLSVETYKHGDKSKISGGKKYCGQNVHYILPQNIMMVVITMMVIIIFVLAMMIMTIMMTVTCNIFNPLNAELNPICHLLALLGVHHFLHVSKIRVKSLTLRLLMSYIYIYIYGAPILNVSRSHTTTQHSR